jgi:cytochrome c553
MASVKTTLLLGLLVAAVCVAGFFAYISVAFPTARCEAAKVKHLNAPEELADCASCHAKTTPREAQDWKESKHGVLLVKCFVCHGQPDGQGAIPFNAKPGYKKICAACHEPAINRMAAKYGEVTDCRTCHPRHQNPVHRNAFEPKTATDKTSL